MLLSIDCCSRLEFDSLHSLFERKSMFPIRMQENKSRTRNQTYQWWVGHDQQRLRPKVLRQLRDLNADNENDDICCQPLSLAHLPLVDQMPFVKFDRHLQEKNQIREKSSDDSQFSVRDHSLAGVWRLKYYLPFVDAFACRSTEIFWPAIFTEAGLWLITLCSWNCDASFTIDQVVCCSS